MKTVLAKLPDELASQLKTLAARLKISEDELIARSLEAYLSTLDESREFQPHGFGMWKDRKGMKDSAAWVRRLREGDLT
jgi:predicted transcriptional regulator